MNKKVNYITYFWKYASNEQIEDMLSLSIDVIADYILLLWQEIYEQKEKSIFNRHNIKISYNLEKLHN